MSVNPKRETGCCIFCGKAGSLTKQHILPNRLRHIIPRRQTSYIRAPIKVNVEDDTVFINATYPRVKNGHVGTKQLRIVCKNCNQGWMNDVEQDAFELLTPLIKGNDVFLSRDNQAKISAVFAIIFTMIDRDHLPTSAIGPSERSFIFDNRAPPDNWNIFIARIRSEAWHFRFRHYGVEGYSKGVISERHRRYNTQVCTLGLGNLLIHVVSCQDRSDVIEQVPYANALGLMPIHKFLKETDSQYIPRHRVAGADRIANALVMDNFASPQAAPSSKWGFGMRRNPQLPK